MNSFAFFEILSDAFELDANVANFVYYGQARKALPNFQKCYRNKENKLYCALACSLNGGLAITSKNHW